MADSKKAAKAFVDNYFPVKQPGPKTPDVFGDLFPSNSQLEPTKKQGYEGQNSNVQRATAGGKSHGSPSKSQSTPQKGNNAPVHCEVSEPCLMSSSVDYGSRDDYPYTPDTRYSGYSGYSGNSYREKDRKERDRKDGSDYANQEVSGAEWWQGSFYY